MAKMGRPMVDNPKNKTMAFRIDNEAYERLKAYSEYMQRSISDIVTEGIELVYEKHPKPQD